MTAAERSCGRVAPDPSAPLRTKVAAGLAALACIGCCALPYLIVAGVLTGAGAAVAQQALIGGAAVLVTVALAMWWLHRRSQVRKVDAETPCGADGCSCSPAVADSRASV